jgi:hypothetical protein
MLKGAGRTAAPKQTMSNAPVTAPGKRHERRLAGHRRQALLFLLACAGGAAALAQLAGAVAATQRLVRVNQALATEIQNQAYRLQADKHAKDGSRPHSLDYSPRHRGLTHMRAD